ncbi:MAG: MBL fold metallo-hydrolase, partial [Rhodospirillales bacterium]|nr:MBL fold metallo-hydrolase [Rhodospirillales bacterium]
SLEDVNDTRYGFRNPNFRYVESVEESKGLNKVTSGAIIMAASGMCDAGRIRFHLENNLWRQQASVLLVGYQAPGTIGDLLQRGASSLRMFGREVAVRARIATIDAYSAHADRSGLIDWVKARRPIRRGVFLVHGEMDSMTSLRQGLIDAGIDEGAIYVPEMDEVFKLAHRGGLRHKVEKQRIAAREVSGEDWHNVYAAFLLDLARRLRSRPDGAGKRAILDALHQTLRAENGAASKRRKK